MTGGGQRSGAALVTRAARAWLGGPPVGLAEAQAVGRSLAREARDRGLAGLVSRSLRRVAPTHPALPELEAARLRTFAGAVRTLDLMRELAHELQRRATWATVLKGGALLTNVYEEDLDLRPLSDLDLLARPGRTGELRAVLRCLGFRAHPPVWRRGECEIDLHEDLIGAAVTGRRRGPYRFDAGLLAAESAPVPGLGGGLRALRPELQLLHSSVHALRHDYRRWCWLLDLCLLLPRCQGRRLRDLASRTGSARALACGLRAAGEWLGDTAMSARARELARLSGVERAFLRAALERPGRIHLGEVIAGFGHQSWGARLRGWGELLAPDPGLVSLRLGRPASTADRRLWVVAAVRAAVADGCRLLHAGLRPAVRGR